MLLRLLAGLDVTPDDVTAMGVGGLLMDIVTRRAPRLAPDERPPAERRIGAVVLAGALFALSPMRRGPTHFVDKDADGEPDEPDGPAKGL